MNPIKTILCGSHYGAVYLPLLAALPEFNFRGIFSRGSERSLLYAQRLDVASYTELNAIPDDIELAVIAIAGDTGKDLALHFLQNRAHVLLEHPITPMAYQQLLNSAAENNVLLFVNSHFRYTSAIADFMERIKSKAAESAPKYPSTVVASASSRTLFSILDILIDCFGKPTAEQLLTHSAQGYQQWLVPLKNCSVLLNYQSWKDEKDIGEDVCMGHSIQAFYAQQSIQLSNTWGPVLEQNQATKETTKPLLKISAELNDVQSVFMTRRRANQHILEDMLSAIQTGKVPQEQQAGHLNTLADLWQSINT